MERLTQQLAHKIKTGEEPSSDAVKIRLKANTDKALQAGVFGVPSFVVGEKVFWGLDSLPMLRNYLEGDAWFSDAQWNGVSDLPSGIPLVRR